MDPTRPGDVPSRWVARYTRYGLYGLVIGIPLGIFALFTNSVPDPSFPWFSLPAQFRLPVTQPRIEHWPVSYTVAIWLWIAGLPALFCWGYARFRRRWRFGHRKWLLVFPPLAMFGLATYCRFFLAKADARDVECTLLHVRLLAVLLVVRSALEQSGVRHRYRRAGRRLLYDNLTVPIILIFWHCLNEQSRRFTEECYIRRRVHQPL